MGSGGSSYQVRTRDEEPEYLKNIRSKLIDTVMPGIESFSADNWTNAQNTANQALSQQKALMSQLPVALNQSNGIANEIANVARTGNIPSAVTNNLNASVNQGLKSSMGSMLSNLASRGVVNSSITGQGINNLAQNAADAYNRNYLNAYNATINGLGTALQGQQANTGALMQGIAGLGAIPGQAYEAASAGITPAFKLWQAMQNSYDNRTDYDTVVQQGK